MKRIIILATVALSAWSCSQEHDDPHTAPTVYDPTQIITVVTDLETRGTPITESSKLMDFGLFCSYTGTSNWASATSTLNKMHNTKLLRTVAGGAWQYESTPVYWDAASASDKYTFFAYAPHATASNGITVNSTAATTGIPTLTYTVPTTDIRLQPDLMVAVPQTDVTAGSAVTLPMKHALTCVGFNIAGNGEKVTKIAISGVYLSGTLSMTSTSATPGVVTWSSLGTYTTTDLSPLLKTSPYTTTSTMTNLLADDGYLMMIPQTLGAGAKLKVTYEDTSSIEFDLSGQVWTAGDMKTYNITTEVAVSPASLIIPHTGTDGSLNNIAVTTSKPGIKWTLQSTDTWLKLSLSASGPGTSSVTGTGPQTVYTFADENATATNRTTTVTLNGTTTVVVKVTQLSSSGGLDVLSNFYIGAFWRAGETGERILRNTTNTTPWVISILWKDANWAADDIMLASGLNSAYTDFAAVNAAPGNAESYKVLPAEAKTSLSGTGKIEFRVGLKTKWSDNVNYNANTAPARYAVLLLSYGTNYGSQQKIFLRQGHEADYVMRDGDAGENITAGARPNAVKFSPYNLTHPDIKSGTNTGGTTIASHPVVPARSSLTAADAPDYFTEYPSQAGAYFQWAVDPTMAAINGNTYTDYERRAYHPTAATTAFTDWNADYTFPSSNAYWTQHATTPLSTANETCPPGWRRPNDGSTSAANSAGAVTDSEMRQSLWLNPPTGNGTSNTNNSVYGYYADGYFDRRTIEASATGVAGSTVSASSSTPAYIGRLFFNPTTNASLFIPAAGFRNYSDGQLSYAGSNGYYWSSSASSTSFGWYLRVLGASQTSGNRSYGFGVRCVPEAIDPSFTVDPFTPDTTPTELK